MPYGITEVRARTEGASGRNHRRCQQRPATGVVEGNLPEGEGGSGRPPGAGGKLWSFPSHAPWLKAVPRDPVGISLVCFAAMGWDHLMPRWYSLPNMLNHPFDLAVKVVLEVRVVDDKWLNAHLLEQLPPCGVVLLDRGYQSLELLFVVPRLRGDYVPLLPVGGLLGARPWPALHVVSNQMHEAY